MFRTHYMKLATLIFICIIKSSNARISSTQRKELLRCNNNEDCHRELLKWWPDLMKDYKEKQKKEEVLEKNTNVEEKELYRDENDNNEVESGEEVISSSDDLNDVINYDAFFPSKDDDEEEKVISSYSSMTLLDILESFDINDYVMSNKEEIGLSMEASNLITLDISNPIDLDNNRSITPFFFEELYSPFEVISACVNNTLDEIIYVSVCATYITLNTYNGSISYYEDSCTITSDVNETDNVDLPIMPGDVYCSDALYFRNAGEYEVHGSYGLNCTIGGVMSECEEIVDVPSIILSVECPTVDSIDCTEIDENRLWAICGPYINDFKMYCPNTTMVEPPFIPLATKPIPPIESLQVKLATSTSFTTYANNNNDYYAPYEAIMPCINNTSSKNIYVSDCNVYSLVNQDTNAEYQEVACLREGRAVPIYPGTQFCSFYALYFRGIGEYTLHSLYGVDCEIGQPMELCNKTISNNNNPMKSTLHVNCPDVVDCTESSEQSMWGICTAFSIDFQIECSNTVIIF